MTNTNEFSLFFLCSPCFVLLFIAIVQNNDLFIRFTRIEFGIVHSVFKYKNEMRHVNSEKISKQK